MDKALLGVTLKIIMDKYINEAYALKFIIGVQPTVIAFTVYFSMYIGFHFYSKKMSKITSGFVNK